jgi:hypothetical protein
MSIIYSPFDVLITQRNANSSSFVEEKLSSLPNAVVTFNSASVLVSLSTGSFSSSYALTSSYSLNAGSATLTTASTYPITSSWAVNTLTASYTTSSATYYYSSSVILLLSQSLTAYTSSANTGSYNVNLTVPYYYILTSGSINFASSSGGPGASVVYIPATGSNRRITFNTNWQNLNGTLLNNSLSGSKSAILSLTSYGNIESQVLAAYVKVIP